MRCSCHRYRLLVKVANITVGRTETSGQLWLRESRVSARHSRLLGFVTTSVIVVVDVVMETILVLHIIKPKHDISI